MTHLICKTGGNIIPKIPYTSVFFDPKPFQEVEEIHPKRGNYCERRSDRGRAEWGWAKRECGGGRRGWGGGWCWGEGWRGYMPYLSAGDGGRRESHRMC